jgi:hypothetical protein
MDRLAFVDTCQQDITSVAQHVLTNRLPLQLSDLPYFVVRLPSRRNEPLQYKDFRVNRSHIRMHLEFYLAYNRNYQGIQIDEEPLSQLPEDGYVSDIGEVESQRLHQIVLDGNGDLPDEVDQQELGPHQSGASGMPSDENGVRELHMGPPQGDVQSEAEQIVAMMQQRFPATLTDGAAAAAAAAAANNPSSQESDDYGGTC